MSERVDALLVTARTSLHDYRVVYPWRLFVFSTAPRAILQVAFFALLGYYAGGSAARDFAFVGAAAHVVVLATVVKAPDVLIEERLFGTLHRLRLGVLHVSAVVAARWWIYAAEGVAAFVVATLGVGLLLGRIELVPRMLAATPIVALVTVTTSCLGMIVAGVSLTQPRAELLAGNLVSYLALILCGVVAPLDALGRGSSLAHALPLTNGLLGVRAVVDGRPWAGHVLAELAVGAGWLLVAAAFLAVQARRSRALGTDDFV